MRTSRRNLLSALAVTATVVAVLGPGAVLAQSAPASAFRDTAIAGWKRRIHAILNRNRLPIIDMQATYIPGTTNVRLMVGFMDELDIAQIAFAAANVPTSAPSLDLYRAHPDYFIPATNSGEYPRWWNNPQNFLTGVTAELKTGQFFLMGEHEFRHYPSPEQVAAGQTLRDITVPIDGSAGQALFQLSTDTGVSFQIHYEIEDRLLPALEAMLERYPKANVIWCHLAMIRYPDRGSRYTPTYITSLIERFPGLHFDLAVPPPGSVYTPSGARDSTLYGGDGKMKPEWRAIIEAHPDRFLAASDYRPPVEPQYKMNMQRQRRLVEELSPTAQHLVAYRNAWRLITGTQWSD